MKTAILVLRILYLVFRVPVLFLGIIGFLMDGSARAEIGWTYINYNLLTGVLICITTIINFVRPFKNEWILFCALLICDATLFLLISKSFPYSYASFESQYKTYAFIPLLFLILIASGQLFKRQKLKT